MKKQLLLFIMILCSTHVAVSMDNPKRVKESKIYPKLILFDFHGTLSLDVGSTNIGKLKERLRKYKKQDDNWGNLTTDNWRTLMNRARDEGGLKAEEMMPSLDDVIDFISEVKEKSHDSTKFAIGSNLEDFRFMEAMMHFGFAARHKQNVNPFNANTVIGASNLMQSGKMPEGEGKLKHISVVLKNLGLQLGKDINYNDIVLIDNSEDDLSKVRPAGVKPIKVDRYFRIKEWNDQYK